MMYPPGFCLSIKKAGRFLEPGTIRDGEILFLLLFSPLFCTITMPLEASLPHVIFLHTSPQFPFLISSRFASPFACLSACLFSGPSACLPHSPSFPPPSAAARLHDALQQKERVGGREGGNKQKQKQGTVINVFVNSEISDDYGGE